MFFCKGNNSKDKGYKEISEEKYNEYFHINGKPSAINSEALKNALEIRKFEIDLYWKRTAYFWTLIAAAFAGYFLLASKTPPTVDSMKSAIACLGFIFSAAWWFVNKGSKQWQENWEFHVDRLEDGITGPLYKTIIKRLPEEKRFNRFINFLVGPGEYSVSKINQIVSLIVTLLWLMLILDSFLGKLCPDFIQYGFVIMAAVTFLLMLFSGKTSAGSHTHLITKRKIYTHKK